MVRVHYQISGDDFFDIKEPEKMAEGQSYEDFLRDQQPIPSNVHYDITGAEGEDQERPENEQPKPE